MPETLLVLRADKELSTFYHFLHHDGGGIFYLYHAIELQSEMFWRTDV